MILVQIEFSKTLTRSSLFCFTRFSLIKTPSFWLFKDTITRSLFCFTRLNLIKTPSFWFFKDTGSPFCFTRLNLIKTPSFWQKFSSKVSPAMKTRTIISLLIIFMNPAPISAHFFPNITSIPASLIPNATGWEAFNTLMGCGHGMTADGLSKLKKYFQYFGYLNSSFANFSDEFDDTFESAVKIYQLNFNLDTTGVIDPPTLKHIVQPRCGNPDMVNGTSTMRFGKPPSDNSTIHAVAHYSFFPNRPRWPASKSELTYAFQPENRVPADVESVFARAFDRWSEVTPLTFTRVTSFRNADIKIGFFSGDHGDGEPFDGVLGTLAHAFAPTVGRLHLDNDENWVVDGGFLNAATPLAAVDLESVAVHEIGHLLGLGHSSVEESIMYPSISSGVRKVELANDDITGIQVLYGSNPNLNGSGPVLTPRQERDTSSAHALSGPLGVVLLVVGFFSLLFV